MSDIKGYGIEFEIVRDDPEFTPGYVYIRLKGSGIHVACVYRQWKSGIFNRKYQWVAVTVFKNIHRGNFIGGYYDSQQEAIDNAVDLIKQIFSRPGELDDTTV